MGVIVPFVYADWAAAYPQFGNIAEPTITGVVYGLATDFQRNDGGGPVNNPAAQQSLLWLMVAHVAQLLYGSNSQPLSPLVGRVASATQGSVSVGVDFPVTPTNAWYMQTTYGAMWWQATAPYRTMRYLPGPRRVFQPWPYG